MNNYLAALLTSFILALALFGRSISGDYINFVYHKKEESEDEKRERMHKYITYILIWCAMALIAILGVMIFVKGNNV